MQRIGVFVKAFAVLVLATAVPGACTQTANPGIKPDADGLDNFWIVEPVFLGTTGPTPIIKIRANNQPTDPVPALMKVFRLVKRGGGQPIAGTWTRKDDTYWLFEPKSPLSTGDYVAEVLAIPPWNATERRVFFHVGPILRVLDVRFYSDSSRSHWQIVDYHISNASDPAKYSVKVERKGEKGWADVDSVTVDNGGRVRLPTMKLSTSDTLRFTLGPDVGAPTGLLLDGNYDGVAGDPLVIVLVGTQQLTPPPKAQGTGFEWKPDIKF